MGGNAAGICSCVLTLGSCFVLLLGGRASAAGVSFCAIVFLCSCLFLCSYVLVLLCSFALAWWARSAAGGLIIVPNPLIGSGGAHMTPHHHTFSYTLPLPTTLPFIPLHFVPFPSSQYIYLCCVIFTYTARRPIPHPLTSPHLLSRPGGGRSPLPPY